MDVYAGFFEFIYLYIGTLHYNSFVSDQRGSRTRSPAARTRTTARWARITAPCARRWAPRCRTRRAPRACCSPERPPTRATSPPCTARSRPAHARPLDCSPRPRPRPRPHRASSRHLYQYYNHLFYPLEKQYIQKKWLKLAATQH